MAKVICDIDGTLSDYSHRKHWLPGNADHSWSTFQSLSHLDAPIPQMIELIRCLMEEGHIILLWTGRNERYRIVTDAWLARHGVPYRELKMRPDDDFQSDVYLKGQWLDELGEQPLFAIDDRKSVVEMFRRRGVICLQPCEGRY